MPAEDQVRREQSRPFSVRGLLARGLAFLVAGLVVALTFRAVDSARVLELLWQVGPAAALILVPYGFGMALENAGWVALLARIGQRLSYWPLLGIVLAGEALQAALPAGVVFAEAIKPPLFARWCGVETPLALAAMAARKYLRLAALVAYLLLSFALGFRVLRDLSRAFVGGPGLEWIALAMALVVAAGAYGMGAAFRHGALAERTHAALAKIPVRALKVRLERSSSKFCETDQHSSRLFAVPPRELAWPLFLALSAWLLESVETWMILRLLGARLSFSSVIGFEAALMLARQVLFVFPAGLGVQDLGYLAVLRALNVPDALAVGAAFSVLKRGKEAVWIVIGSGIVLTARSYPARASKKPAVAWLAAKAGAVPGQTEPPVQ